MNSIEVGEYFEEDDKTNVNIENPYFVENIENVGEKSKTGMHHLWTKTSL